MSELKTLVRITAPHFVAGFELDQDNRIVNCAPIIAYVKKIGVRKFLQYCDRKGWKVECI